MDRRTKKCLVVLASCAPLVLGTEATAAASTTCSSLPTPVYGSGGSAQLPYLAQVGTQLASLTPPVSLVYYDGGSACGGYENLVTPSTISGTANYWSGDGTQSTCTLDPGGDPVTFAVMGNAPNLCPQVSGLAPGFGQFLGPAQPVDFVVPFMSNEQSISTDAAYYIWGFGASDAAHSVSPWNVKADIFTRSSSSFVNVFIALDTGVPAATVALSGTVEASNGATVTALNNLNNTSAQSNGIGFVSGEVADGNRGEIKVLAYQHRGQSCGYYPDSSITAFDKVNVRDGQYWLWSPIHFYAAIGDAGGIVDPTTASIIGYVTQATAPPPGFDPFRAAFAAYTVPKCAMHVWRDGDLAELYSYAAPASCSCEFDIASNNANKPASCKTCLHDSDCPTAASHCRNIGAPFNSDAGADVGYCEVN